MTGDPHGSAQVYRAGAPLEKASLAVVLLHGRGASAPDILGLAEAFDLPGVVYLAPQAAGHTWYPLSFLAQREANEPYLSSALAMVDSVVRSLERAGLSRERVALAGFSQGACLATEFVASHPERYAGLIAYTGGLIGPQGSVLAGSAVTSRPLAGTPALLTGGDPDPHVPWTRVAESADRLEALGASVTARRFPGRPHTITPQEVVLGRDLLRSALG